MTRVWHKPEARNEPQYGGRRGPGAGVPQLESHLKLRTPAGSKHELDQTLAKVPPDNPPSYDSVVDGAAPNALSDQRQMINMGDSMPAMSAQHAKDLAAMQKALKQRAKRDDDTSRRLAGVRDLDSVHEIIASSLLHMLGVLPESELNSVVDSAAEILASYHMDSVSSVRIATWARRSFGLSFTMSDFATDEAQTLDDAAFMVASKYVNLTKKNVPNK